MKNKIYDLLITFKNYIRPIVLKDRLPLFLMIPLVRLMENIEVMQWRVEGGITK